MISPVDLARIGVLGGVFSLDYMSGFRLMIHQPLVASSVAGYLLGDFTFGVTVGILLQLVYVGEISIGASRADDTGIASVVAVAAGRSLDQEGIIAFSVGAGVIFGHLSSVVEIWITRLNSPVGRRIEKAIDAGRTHLVDLFLIVDILIIFFLAAAVSIVGSISSRFVAERFLTVAPVFVRSGLRWARYLLPVVGVAVLINTFKTNWTRLMFLFTLICLILLTALIEIDVLVTLIVLVLISLIGLGFVRRIE